MPDCGEVQRSILQYYRHACDLEYLAEVIGAVERPALDRLIVDLLAGNADDVQRTCIFIRDLILPGSQHEGCKAFSEAYFGSPVVEALERLTSEARHFIGWHAIYTLGKTGSKSSLPALRGTFHARFETDPLLVPKLLGEIFWLDEREDGQLIEEAVGSSQYLTRWAILGMYDCRSEEAGSPGRELRVRTYAQLLRDSNERVRAEAEYQQALLDLESKRAGMAKAERRAATREVERSKPLHCFSDVEVRFYNHLHENGKEDYSVSELDEFVRSLPVKRP